MSKGFIPVPMKKNYITGEMEPSTTDLLHPGFWTALGKAMGWKNETKGCQLTESGVKALCSSKGHRSKMHKDIRGLVVGESRDKKCWSVLWDRHKTILSIHKSFIRRFGGKWLDHWHRFIDKLASGGTADEFFKDLLGGTDL